MKIFATFIILFIIAVFCAAFFSGGYGHDTFEELDASLKEQIQHFE
jgi:hypothetical protein